MTKRGSASSRVFGALTLIGWISALTATNGFLVPSSSSRIPAASKNTRIYYQRDGNYGYQETPSSAVDVSQNVRPIQADQQSASLFQMRSRGGQMQLARGNTNNGNIQNQGPMISDQQQQSSGRMSRSSSSSTSVQGGSLRTYHNGPHSLADTNTPNHVHMQTDGRPLYSNYELWEGPDNTPTRMKIYSEDGQLRPFNAVFENRGNPYNGGGGSYSNGNVMSVRNSGPMEFPMTASVGRSNVPSYNNPQQQQQGQPQSAWMTSTATSSRPRTTIQGGALKTWSYDHSVASVQVSLTTDGLPMYALVEHWGVDGHVKQIAEIYNENGAQRPFHVNIATPGGSGDTIAIRNTGPMEYPISASLEPIHGPTDYYPQQRQQRPHHEQFYTGGGWQPGNYYGSSRGMFDTYSNGMWTH